MFRINTPDYVEMDDAHIALIKGMAMALKPSRILELGIGSGKTTNALIEAVQFNRNNCSITVVDNWCDWQGVQPEISGVIPPFVEIVTKDEEQFVRNESPLAYDLIVSDADHKNSHKWWRETLGLLTFQGVAFFHDITNPDYPNLRSIEFDADLEKWQTKVFNKSSTFTERCSRGLLMVYKL